MYVVNRDFFNTFNEASLYVAGFIAADGSVSDNNIEFGLARKDHDQLELIKKLMGSEHPIRDVIYNGYEQSRLSIGSLALLKDLEKFNIVPNKSLTYEMPEWLINYEQAHHFLRGYTDGDGCWRIFKSKRSEYLTAAFKILGTQKFIDSFLEILQKNCAIRANKRMYKYKNIYRLDFGGLHIVKDIASFLYKDSTIWMQRKRALVDRIVALSNNSVRVMRPSPSREDIIRFKMEFGTQKAVARYLGFSPGRISQILNGK